jgi:transposase-like protein
LSQTFNTTSNHRAGSLADEIGIAARELKLYKSQLYHWRAAVEKKSTTSERDSEPAAEVASLKRQLTEQNSRLLAFITSQHYLGKINC